MSDELKAAMGPGIQFLGALVLGAVIWFGLSHYSKRTNEEIAAANNRPEVVVTGEKSAASMIPSTFSAPATTATPSIDTIPSTPAIPESIDPMKRQLSDLRAELEQMRLDTLRARLEADAAAMRAAYRPTPPPMAAPPPQPQGRYLATLCHDRRYGKFDCVVDTATGAIY